MPTSNYDEPSLTALAASITTIENDHSKAAHEPHAPLFGKYELGKLLGCGGFAKVYQARDIQTGESVAVKAVSKRKIERLKLTAHVKREISIMRRLDHPHIIRLIEVLATRTKIYFIMEFAKGGELLSKLSKGRFSEDLSRRYFHQLISAVGYCHSRGIYHRDLKPENILLDENWKLKISDFGLSAELTQPKRNQMFHTLCGTPSYVAPEILARKGYDGAKIDIWSCGITLFVLNSGYLPFNDTNVMNLYRKIYRGEYRCPQWFSPELRRFLGRLLDTDPKTRISIEGILEDPWFKVGFNEVKPEWYDSENEKMVKKGQYLNAFDLISFSPGFSLSRLFDLEEGSCQERHVAVAEEAEAVVGTVEDAARGIHTPRVEVERVKGGMGVKVQGQNGNFGLVVEVYRLTKELVVVEVRKSEKDVGPSDEFWREILKPKIMHLFVEPDRTGSRSDSS